MNDCNPGGCAAAAATPGGRLSARARARSGLHLEELDAAEEPVGEPRLEHGSPLRRARVDDEDRSGLGGAGNPEHCPSPTRRRVVPDELEHHATVDEPAGDGVVETAVCEPETEAALGLPEERLVPEGRRQDEDGLAGSKARAVELRGEEAGPGRVFVPDPVPEVRDEDGDGGGSQHDPQPAWRGRRPGPERDDQAGGKRDVQGESRRNHVVEERCRGDEPPRQRYERVSADAQLRPERCDHREDERGEQESTARPPPAREREEQDDRERG